MSRKDEISKHKASRDDAHERYEKEKDPEKKEEARRRAQAAHRQLEQLEIEEEHHKP